MAESTLRKRYWRAHLKLLGLLLSIWFLFGVVLSILLVKPLNEIRIAGFPLGFWIAQQGAIFVFVLLILVYAILMDRTDRKYQAEEER